MTSIETILHIGTGKAGSSTIQNFFSERRNELAKHNILYPLGIRKGNILGANNHKCLAFISINFNKEKLVFKQQKVFSEEDKKAFEQRVIELYSNQLRNASEKTTCILSAEHFWSQLTEEKSIFLLRQNFAKLNLKINKIIIYLREQVQWLKSSTQQKVIEGSATSLEVPYKDDNAIKSRLDYFETIQLWKHVFPEATIVPRIFEYKRFEGGNLIYDFLNACGEQKIIKHYTDTAFKQSRNVSTLTLEGYLLLALFNKYEKKSKKPSLNTHGRYSYERKEIIKYLQTNFGGKPDHFFTKDLAAHIHELFKDSNEKLRQEYFSSHPVLFDKSYINDLPTSQVLNKLPYNKLVEYLYNCIVSTSNSITN